MGKLFDKDSIIDIAKQASLNDTDKYKKAELLDQDKVFDGLGKGVSIAATGAVNLVEGTIKAADGALEYFENIMPQQLENKFRAYLNKKQECNPE